MPPLCPKCKAPMVLRTAKKGKNIGNQFWGCSNYPKCRGTRDYIPDGTVPTLKTPAPAAPVSGKAAPKPEPAIVVDSPLQFEAEPFSGFGLMQAFETIACEEAILNQIKNENLSANAVRYSAKFRVDYTEPKYEPLGQEQRELLALVLRLLCRGTITRNSMSVEDSVTRMFQGEPDFSDSDFIESRYLLFPKPNYIFDSDREKEFANKNLFAALGPAWPLFTSTQVQVHSLGKPNFGEPAFPGQRVDFYISTGKGGFVIELDGDEHAHHKGKDADRDAFLSKNGCTVLRFTNNDIDVDPASVDEVLSENIQLPIFSGDEKSLEQLRIIASKIIHQLQIAVVTGLLNATLAPSSKLAVKAQIKGITSGRLNKLFTMALLDLKELIDNYCDLYGIDPFFSCEFVRDNADAAVFFGEAVFCAPATVLITELTTEKEIYNRIPSYVDLQIAEISEDVLNYFLNYVFHHKNGFREGQLPAIERLLNGQDTIVLLPTGSGKSLIYQLAGLICPGKIIVVSPLVSLMQDQLDNLANAGIDCAVSVSRDVQTALEELNSPGTVLIYISPERLQIKSFRDCIDMMQTNNKIFAVAVDEAHCVSEWGHDFRTAYLNIGRTSRAVFNLHGSVPTLIALTGTASTAVLKDVKRELEITDYAAIITPETFDRKELKFKVVKTDSDAKKTKLVDLFLNDIPDFFGHTSALFYKLRDDKTNCGIVFCPHVNGDFGVVKVNNYLNPVLSDSDFYSGKSPKGFKEDEWERLKRQIAQRFKSNKVNTLVATKAFGMGIDKPNVRFTVHYGIPSSIESFYQEAGRAGRDGGKSLCVLMLSDENDKTDDYLLNPTTPLEKVHEAVEEQTYDEKDDVSRILFFHNNAFRGIPFELTRISDVVNSLFVGNALSVKDVIIKCGEKEADNSLENVQKALQRLLVLGVVSDYTVDYSAREILVKPGSADPADIQAKYALYVKGYNEGRIARELRKLNVVSEQVSKQYVLNAAKVLTEFVYDTIEKGRRRGLREMVNAAEAALKSKTPDKTLRQRIVRYFESTYSEELTSVVESPDLGFDKIQEIIDGTAEETGGEVVGGIRSANEAAGLRGGVSRFLESTPDHPGLLALRALAELYCKDFNLDQIRSDFEASCSFAVNRYSCDLDRLRDFCVYFMRKVIERDPEVFASLVDCTSAFLGKRELCSLLIDTPVLTEGQKSAPALVLSVDIAESCLKMIKMVKGE